MAKILGLYPIKEELEELGFKYSAPENYRLVRRQMDKLASENASSLQQARLLSTFTFSVPFWEGTHCKLTLLPPTVSPTPYACMHAHTCA